MRPAALAARICAMNRIDLDGRNAVITGGCRGIGLAVADRFVKSGATVTIWDVDVPAMKRVCAERIGWTWQQVDVASETAVDIALKASINTLGCIDILVNAAGIAGSRVLAVDCPLSEWQRVLDVNLTGTFLCSRAVVRHMRERGYGRVINLASIAGKEGNAMGAHYSAAKAGVTALTKAMAKESLEGDIRINAVAPAAIDTEFFSALPAASQSIAISRIPLGRVGTVDEVAALIAWMASEECSFTTGFTFDASGGRATY
jgi:2-dehydro-3-deoxy-L-rhamnonate dehydrogenase (NAD+)